MSDKQRNHEDKLINLIRSDPLLVKFLEAITALKLPNWYMGGGIIRARIWDFFHGYISTDKENPIRDVDVVFYYKDGKGCSRKTLEKKLKSVLDFDWDVKNSAYLHEWYKKKYDAELDPLECVEQDIECWPEPATCVAVRLLSDNRIKVYAPWGLDDLMNMILRRNTYKTRNVTPELFEKRARGKRINERWPKVKVIYG